MSATFETWSESSPAPHERAAITRARLGGAIGFADCPDTVLDELVLRSHLRTASRGEFVLRRGDAPDAAIMVVSGMLESNSLHRNGSRHLVGLLLPGDLAGLIGVVDGQPHINDSLARHDALLMHIPAPVLRELRRREPSVVLACEQQLVFRSRLLYARLYADPGVELKARAADALLTLGKLYGHADEDGVGIKFSQSDLADWLGLSRQRMNFALRQLQGEGLIELGYGAVRIVDEGRLRDCAQI